MLALNTAVKSPKKKIYARRLFAKYLNVVVRSAESKGEKKGAGFGNRKAESPRSKTKSAGICSLQNTVARSPCPARDAMRCEALESEEQKKKREKERR